MSVAAGSGEVVVVEISSWPGCSTRPKLAAIATRAWLGLTSCCGGWSRVLIGSGALQDLDLCMRALAALSQQEGRDG